MDNHFRLVDEVKSLHSGLNQEWYDTVLELEAQRGKCKNVDYINQDLKRTRKAIVVLGCSFADGQGSISEEIIQTLTPKYNPLDNVFDYNSKQIDIEKLCELAIKYHLPINYGNNDKTYNVGIYRSELNNSWGSKLSKMFNDEYTIVNFADRGAGNNCAIKKMHRYPIDWDLCDEVIVLWSVCDYTRWGFLHGNNLNFNEITGDYRTMWWTDNKDATDLNGLFSKEFLGPMFYITEYLENCSNVKTWCKQFNKQNIVVMPAFSTLPENAPTMEWHYFLSQVALKSSKNIAKGMKAKLLTEYVWDVNGKETLVDLLLEKEDLLEGSWHHIVNDIKGKGTKNGWISPCTHPTNKAQTLISELLYDHLNKNVL